LTKGLYTRLRKVIQAMNNATGADGLIRRAYETLKTGDARGAHDFLRQALEVDFEHSEVLYALKCLAWWLEKLKRLDEFSDPYQRGEYVLSQWEAYYVFLQRMETGAPVESSAFREAAAPCQYAIKSFVFSVALDCFQSLLADAANQHDPTLLLQAGRCCKGAGNWEQALAYLEQAGRCKREDSAILSELADVNALLGETRIAKVLFREAFFLDPQGINLSGLESEMILALSDKVSKLGVTGSELAEWIPVWGNVWGVFSIKRELKPVELGKLKQSILTLDGEHRSKSGGNAIHVKPRLLNRYFWLIDHCEHNRDTTGLIEQTMRNIQLVDHAVYEQYRV
jgi:tetratricopeptide (TPR) repeat protein